MKKMLIMIAGAAISLTGIALVSQADEAGTTAPAAIANLSIGSVSSSSVTLNWSASGDDGSIGTSTAYDLRYSTASITDTNWASSTVVSGLPAPQIAGTSQAKIVSGLSASTLYYFAIKSKNETNNWSVLSNVVSTTTLTGSPSITTADVIFEMNITPETLNTASQGQWITAHLFLQGYSPSSVDFSSLKMNGTLAPDPNFKGTNLFDNNNKNKEKTSSNFVLKFSRAQFVQLAAGQTGSFSATLTGKVGPKTFSASDTIEMIQKNVESEDELVTSTSTPEVYIIKNGKKRHIPSAEAFNRMGLQWTKIKKLSLAELNSYLENNLVKTVDNPAVYILSNGKKRHIPTVEVFNSYGFSWADISIISGADLANYFTADLVRAAGDSRVYLLSGGKKLWVKTLETFNKRGFRWENVIVINQAEEDAIPEGQSVQ